MAVVCSSCGQENPEGNLFCGACGTALAEAAPAVREVRKTVTVLFCDVTGSTALGERLDPEALRRLMRRYFDEIAAIVRGHGGTVEKFIGDAVMAVFGIPVAHEDDALRAVRAAAEIRERLPELATELGVALDFRTGVNTGEVVVGEGQTLATGDAVNVAARLEQAAEPGEILIGAATRTLVRDAVETEAVEPLAVKGKSRPVEAFRLRHVDPGAPAVARRLDTPFVGRSRELGLLRQALDRVEGERTCHLFTLLGPAGVGKSRLVSELLVESEGRAILVRGRCLHYGDGITFWPVVEMLKELGPDAADTLERLVEGTSASPQELFWEVRRVLERVAAEHPLVAVFDDLHWAEPMLLDLLDHVADLSRDAPILLLCVARQELLDSRPGWAGGKLNATTLLLEPLATEEAEVLLDELGDGLAATLRRRVIEAAEGNPLFLEEMAALVREGGGIAVPPTIQALLQARLDRLSAGERAVIERAAVEGKVFHRRSVIELSPPQLRETVDAQLASLVRKELIRPERAALADDAFRFRHQLIRDAAYDALSKELRADLHERYAGWLEEHGGELIELDELLGYHLEQAAGYRRELGSADGPLEARAADRLRRAGAKAAGRADYSAADKLLSRALALLVDDEPTRGDVILELVGTLRVAGEFERANLLLDELAGEREPLRAAHVRINRLLVQIFTEPASVGAEAEALRELMPLLQARGDDRGLALAALLRFDLAWLAARSELAEDAARDAIAHAQRAGDRHLLVEAINYAGLALTFAAAPVDEVERRLAALDGLIDELGMLARPTDLGHAFVAAQRGDFDRARTIMAEARAVRRELGDLVIASAMGTGQAHIELQAGRLAEAERFLRESDEALAELGERGYRSTVLASLATICYRAGDAAEAERLAAAAEQMSAPEDLINFVYSRTTLAMIAADRGEHERAAALAAEAHDFAFRTDFPEGRTLALDAAAHVARAAGRQDEARAALEQALAINEAKGDVVTAARLRGALAGEPVG